MGVMREVWNTGDPGRHKFFRRFKGLRGRLKGLGRFARFVPGVGTVMDTIENARALVPAGDGGFYYADDEGDPSDFFDEGDPGKKKPRRGAPSRAGHAGHKGSGKHGKKKKHGGGPGLGASIAGALGNIDVGKLGQAAIGSIPVIGGVAGELAGQLAGGAAGAGEEGMPMIPGVAPGAMPMAGGGGGKRGFGAKAPHLAHRKKDAWLVKGSRSMNATNPRALRHALRRVEGFERIVKRLERAYPRLKRAHPMHGHVTHHKAGRK